MGVDPKKIETVKSCLEASFRDVRHQQVGNDEQRFVFNAGTQTSQLVIPRTIFDDILPEQLAWLRAMVNDLIPTLKANPGKKVSVSNSGIEVSENDPI